MRKILISILMIVYSFTALLAQSRSEKKWYKRAQIEIQQNRFAYAIPFLKQYLLIQPKDTTALQQLALTYTKINQFDSALQYYQIAYDNGLKPSQIYAELLANNKKYEKSIQIYQNIIADNKTKWRESRMYGFKNIHQFYKDSIDFTLHNTSLNTEFNEYGATPFQYGLVFESNRPVPRSRSIWNIFKPLFGRFGWDAANYTRLYFVTSRDSVLINKPMQYNPYKERVLPENYTRYARNTPNDNNKIALDITPIDTLNKNASILLFNKQFSNKFNVGSVSFTADGKEVFYTMNQHMPSSNGEYLLEIWTSKFINGNWSAHTKMFFNTPRYSYFHPCITPDGKRLYYVSDDIQGIGGTDIYYIDRNEDGSWQGTKNAGQDINTEGNELFPTFSNGNLYFSSNGHPGLGGLDIFKVARNANNEIDIVNLGYPINSEKDDLGYYSEGSTGFFSSNRFGSDDIIHFSYNKSTIILKGALMEDGQAITNGKVYLKMIQPNGQYKIIDSLPLDAKSNFAFNVRPNQEYKLEVINNEGQSNELTIASNDYIQVDKNRFEKDIKINNLVSNKVKLQETVAKEDAIKAKDIASMTTTFKRQVDSLQGITKDMVVLHHPFDQVYVVSEDLPKYYTLIERLKRLQNKQVVIVSAADCAGSLEYNEDLADRRAKHIYKTLSKLSNNEVIVKQVGERELLKNCDEAYRDKQAQLENRYTYIFILDKK